MPLWSLGFFAAVLVGSVLSSFNSALNSAATIFGLEIYKVYINKDGIFPGKQPINSKDRLAPEPPWDHENQGKSNMFSEK